MAIEHSAHISPERWVLLGSKFPIKNGVTLTHGMVVVVQSGKTDKGASGVMVAGVYHITESRLGTAGGTVIPQFVPAKGNVFYADNVDADNANAAINPTIGSQLDIDSAATGLTAASNNDVTVVDFDSVKDRIYFVFNDQQQLF